MRFLNYNLGKMQEYPCEQITSPMLSLEANLVSLLCLKLSGNQREK